MLQLLKILPEKLSSDKHMYDYIQKDVERAFINGVQKVEDKAYLLNIASTEDFGAFEWKNAKDIIDRQLTVFMPIVQKFMVSALSKTL